jgi:hypothetical protein
MSAKRSPLLSRDELKINYKKHLKTKALLCKLPVVNMSRNTFSAKFQ